MVGTATPSPAAVRFGYATYALTTDPTLSDLRVLATSHVGAQHAWLAWPRGGTRRVRSGKDSADLELLDYMKGSQIVACADRMGLASGDGTFAETVARLQGDGTPVIVVARPGSVSARRAVTAGEVRYLPDLTLGARFIAADAWSLHESGARESRHPQSPGGVSTRDASGLAAPGIAGNGGRIWLPG